ncbi:hypothetical protein MXB_530 [Myxobolus squamalis]|nr:hypothetical protein MXB_530 [Myxobolus squamalis]
MFMPFDLQILINSELWDLRTFKLLSIINNFHETVLKRNQNDTLVACILESFKFSDSIPEETKLYNRVIDRLHSWFFGPPLPGNSLSFHESKNFSMLGISIYQLILAKKISFPDYIFVFDVSQDGKKFLTLNNSAISPTTLRIHELGYPIHKESDVSII